MMVYLTWVISVFSLIGVILNIKKKQLCFVIWLCTNTAWCVIDALRGIPAQSVLFFVYAIMAIWGIYEWRSKKGNG